MADRALVTVRTVCVHEHITVSRVRAADADDFAAKLAAHKLGCIQCYGDVHGQPFHWTLVTTPTTHICPLTLIDVRGGDG